MRPVTSLRWLAVAAFVLGVSGSATAQSGGGAAPGGDAQVGFERKATLSSKDQLSQADAILTRLDQASGAVRRQLERARTSRDVVKSLCLNDKLSQIDVAGRTAKDRQSALQAAVQRSDMELSNHEFAIMTVLRQRAEQLVAEANQCLGEEVAFVGQTQITTEISTGLPTEETDGYPPTDPTLITAPATPPICNSCVGGP
jgi:hypothetical protein